MCANIISGGFDDSSSGAIPTTDTFNAVLNIWAQSGAKHAPQRGERIVKQMEALSNSQQLRNIEPDLDTYNALLLCYMNSGFAEAEDIFDLLHGPERIQEIIVETMELKEIYPNNLTYTIGVSTLADVDCPDLAEALLVHMCKIYLQEGDDEARPTIDLFNTVLLSWAKTITASRSLAAQRAERLLKRAEQMQTNGVLEHYPTYVSFNSVIKAWSKDKGNTKAGENAENIYRQMVARFEHTHHADCKPDKKSFTGVTKAWIASGVPGLHDRINSFQNEYRNKFVKDVDSWRDSTSSAIL